jgi:alkaline phosphatase D
MKAIVALVLFFMPVILWCEGSAHIISGPMVTHADMRQVQIWVQLSGKGTVQVYYSPLDDSTKERKSRVYSADSGLGYRILMTIDSVDHGKRYAYSIYINGKKEEIQYPLEFQIPALWQWRSDPPNFTVALGSCFYVNEEQYDRPGKPYGGDYPIVNSIVQKKPDLMIWLGDNVYMREADYSSKIGIIRRYEHTRALPELQSLLGSVHHYAIWDDHDYGPNDSDRGYTLKHEARDVFKQFWGNPTYGNAKQEGIYTTFQWGDVQFFLLDNRFFRSPNKRITSDRTILGEEQKQWLIDNLVSSNATFKVIALGGQFLNPIERFENYANYKVEQQEIIETLAKESIPGVFFLSGDRHYSEMSELKTTASRLTYPLLDFTVSPLTSGTFTSKTDQDKNPLSVPGSEVYERNYGMLEFSGTSNDRSVTFILYDKSGKELWRMKRTSEELGVKKKK